MPLSGSQACKGQGQVVADVPRGMLDGPLGLRYGIVKALEL